MLFIKDSMLKAKVIDGIDDSFIKLYQASFPENERMPLSFLCKHTCGNDGLITYYNEENQMVGISACFLFQDIVYLAYLAIDKQYQNKGYGTAVLNSLTSQYQDRTIVIDIEIKQTQEAKRRRQFYLKNNFLELNLYYYFFGVEYELLSIHRKIRLEEFKCLIEYFYRDVGRYAKFWEKS